MLERELWLPEGTPRLNQLYLGKTEEEGDRVASYGFTYRCKCGNELQIMAMAEETASSAQIEDMLNASFEREMKREEERHQRQAEMSLSPDTSQWDASLTMDVAEELRHIRNWLRKRKWSSNRKTIYTGVSVDAVSS